MSFYRFVILTSVALATLVGSVHSSSAAVEVIKTIGAIEDHAHVVDGTTHTVKINASVTFFNRTWGTLYVQDETGAVRVQLGWSKQTPDLLVGDRVEIEGTFTAAEDRSPWVVASNIEKLGDNSFPDPLVVELARPKYDGQLVEISCSPYFFAGQDFNYRYYRAVCRGESITLVLPLTEEGVDPSALLHRETECRGVLAHKPRDSRIDLYVIPDGVTVVASTDDTPETPQPRSIAEVKATRDAELGTTTTVRGLIWVANQRYALISDGTGHFVVDNRDWRYSRGDLVQCTGDLVTAAERFQLKDQSSRFVARPERIRVMPKDVNPSALDSELGNFIRLNGTVVSSWLEGKQQWIRMNAEGRDVYIRALTPEKHATDGSGIRLVGVITEAPVPGGLAVIGKTFPTEEVPQDLLATAVNQSKDDSQGESAAAIIGLPLSLVSAVVLTFLAVATTLLVGSIRARQRDEEQRRFQHGIEKQLSELSHIARLNTLSDMVGALAHELNQPLSAITNFSAAAQLTLESKRSDEDLVVMLEKIGEQSLRAGTVIRRLRALVKRETAGRSRTDISHVVEQSVELFRTQFALENGLLDVDLNREIPLVDVDEIQIQQVVLNLLANARDAVEGLIDPKPRIAIGTEYLAGKEVVVWVEDNGEGMTDVERIFDRYFTTKEKGTGLGLAISKTIVESHGGTIAANAVEPHGTRIRFTIPVAQTQSLQPLDSKPEGIQSAA